MMPLTVSRMFRCSKIASFSLLTYVIYSTESLGRNEKKKYYKLKLQLNENGKILQAFAFSSALFKKYIRVRIRIQIRFVVHSRNLCRVSQLEAALRTRLVGKIHSIGPIRVLLDCNFLDVVQNRMQSVDCVDWQLAHMLDYNSMVMK